jgi:hypothetical protein
MCSTNLRVASPRAFYAESFVPLGVVPGDGVAWLLTKVIGPMRAAEMALTGDRVSATTALEWDMVEVGRAGEPARRRGRSRRAGGQEPAALGANGEETVAWESQHQPLESPFSSCRPLCGRSRITPRSTVRRWRRSRANAPASIRGIDTRDRVRPTSCENVRAPAFARSRAPSGSAKAPLLGVPETDLSELVAPLYDRLANADHTECGDGSAAFSESHRHAVTSFDSHARGCTHAGGP